jgi:hypothetical protein
MRFQTTEPDPATSVSSVVAGYFFNCPDIASVDRHLAELRMHLQEGSNVTEMRKRDWRRDIDRLLDRRLYLRMTATDNTAA